MKNNCGITAKARLLLPAILIILNYIPVFAMGGQRPELTLEELLREAVDSNPSVMSVREEAVAAEARISYISAYPFPTLSYAHFIESIETRLGPQKDILQLMQKVPFPGKLSLKADIARDGAGILKARSKEAELSIIRKVKDSFYTVAEAEAVLELLEKEREILEDIREIIEVRLESGREYQHNLLRIEVELLRIDEKRVTYREKRSSAVSSIRSLLDRKPGSTLKINAELGRLPGEVIPGRIMKDMRSHPLLKARQRMADRARREEDLARKGYLPDFTIGGGYMRIGDPQIDIPDSGRDAWNISVAVNLPLWFGAIRGRIEERSSIARAMELNLRAERNRKGNRIEELWNRYVAAAKVARLYGGELIPRAEQALESTREGYIAGKVDFVDILDSERMLISLKIKLIEKKAQAFRNLAMLEEVSGSELIPEN